MDLQLNEEQEMIRKMARDFAQNEVAPVAAELDEKDEPPLANLKKMAELGFMGLAIPEEYEGIGADSVSYVIAIEEISKACASTGVILAVHNSLGSHGLVAFGTEEQKQKFLPPLASGEWIATFGLTEPETGSDAASIKTKAVLDGDEYVINGTKQFITSAPFAHLFIIFAVTDPSKKHRGLSAFVVEKGTSGFSLGREENKMGIRAASTCGLVFEDCRVPVANRLGEEGEGFKIAMSSLDAGRVGIAAQAVGIAQGAYEAALAYAKERHSFGQPIAEFQGIQWMLADMATRIEAACLLTYQSALAKDRAKKTGERYSKEAAMAKLFASETAVWVTQKAVQIHGGYGYIKEYAVERYYRDAKITEIYEGTSEIQRIVIANQILR
ncbi:MAG: acyl-CoA dehydrogenase [Anaerolineales bacterium]|nr:MAG: acyl-CoA dehydrogenase [Anaerolineales bacterium]